MSEPRTPKILLQRLENRVGNDPQLDYHIFRGIVNGNKMCYIISLLQLFFHSSDFLEYIDELAKKDEDDIENKNELLLTKIYKDLYSGKTRSINIKEFYENWKGWAGNPNLGFPEDIQDVLEFFLNFTNSVSKDLQSLFSFKMDQKKNHQNVVSNFLSVNITSRNLRDCVLNALNEYENITNFPQLLFIQLNRASDTDHVENTLVGVNKTIIFGGLLYSFVGAVIFESILHYHSIIRICNEGFDFDDSIVSPLFLDQNSVFPSSYNRCLNAETNINRNAVLFLYEPTDHDDLGFIHFSPNMQRMMSDNAGQSNIIQIHEISENSEEKYIEVSNKELAREDINVETIECNDLKGVVKISSKGVPPNVIEPIKDNRFMKNRQLFKWVANVMRELKEVDQGKLNSELLSLKLDLESDEIDFIQEQGCILYDIMKNLLEKNDLRFNDVLNALQPIVDSYEAKYRKQLCINSGKIPIFTANDEYEEIKPLKKGVLEEEEENSDEDDSNNEEDDDDDSESTIPPNEISLKHGKGSILNDYGGFRIWKTTTNSFEDLSLDYSNEKVNPEDDECPNGDDSDDNQFSLRDYNWKERVEMLNASNILEEIRKNIKNKFNKRNPISLESKSDLQIAIKYEALRSWEKYKKVNERPVINYFAKDWIANNVTCKEKNSLVIAYNSIIDTENKRKLENAKNLLVKMKVEEEDMTSLLEHEKEDPIQTLQNICEFLKRQGKNINSYEVSKEYSLSPNTVKHWISKYNKDEEEQEKAKEKTVKWISEWGGPHNTKLNDEVLLCLICMALDFPNMTSKQFASYLNSEYGPCFAKKKKIKPGTVSRALRYLNFSMKKVAFCPPTRNSIGLRIYRVAWSLLMQEISNQNDVLIGFIDEAAVSIADGKKYGRSFVGITPLINSPLSNCKVSVLSCVLPGYGVLYKFFNSAVHGSDYACFLNDITQFVRIHICSSNTQIVMIEDNCKIHCTEEVENVINKLEIAVIPTVPYSPALNGVVEGYFGYVKLGHCEFYSFNERPIYDEIAIKETWTNISNMKFNDKKANTLYAEWKARMARCVEGIPLVSGHISIDGFENDADRLLNVNVFRHYKEVIYA